MATKTQTDPKKAPKSGAKAAPKASKAAVSKPAGAAAPGARGKATSAGRRKSATRAAATTPNAASAAPKAPAAPAKKATPSAATAPANAAAPVTTPEAVRRPDLIQAIADRVSLKRSEAKMVFDVVLDEIGKALDANDEVIVPPLGKMMVKKRIDKPKGAMLTVKLKRAEADPTAGDVAPIGSPLAKPAEQG